MTKTLDDISLVTIVSQSRSIREVIKRMGLIPAGGNYRSIKKRIARIGLDTTHFTGQASNIGNHQPRRDIYDYLTNRYPIQSHRLRVRLIREGFFEHQCSGCGNKEWLGKPIPLELEHKDGNHGNNKFDNLCLLCPNCHALTTTYRGKNVGRRHKDVSEQMYAQDGNTVTVT